MRVAHRCSAGPPRRGNRAVTGYGKATITAHVGVQPFTDRSLKLPGAHGIADSRKVFGGPLTQSALLATKQTEGHQADQGENPTLF